jgi:hypothetical protein
VALILAHQRLQQLQPYVLDALYGATSIKFAAKVSDAAAHALARDMRTTPEFILDQPPYHFAAFVRGVTSTALSLGIPATDMNTMPRMTRAEYEVVRRTMRERYAARLDELRLAVTNTVPPKARSLSTQPQAPRSTPHTADPFGDDWRS